MNQKRMIQLIRSNEASLTLRLSAVEELYDHGTPEALIAVCHAAFSQSTPLADRSRELIQKLGYTQFEGLMNLLLEGHLNAYTRKRAFDLLRTEKTRDLLRYVVQRADALSQDPAKAKLLSSWLRQTKLTHEWIRDILTLPLDIAIQLSTALKKVDATLPLAIARIAKDGGPKARIRAMDILGRIADGRDIVPFVISATVSDNAELRSKAILVLGRTSDKLSIIENALTDEDARVRANAVETLWGMDTDDARMLLRQAVRDPDNRVRANAAKGLYELGHPLGLQTLLEMLQMEEPGMRMSAAWVLGEVNALEAIPELRARLKDADSNVQRNSALALEKMGVRLLNMRRYFRYFKDRVVSFSDRDISSVSRFIMAARTLVKLAEQKLRPLLEDVIAVDPKTCQVMYQVLQQHCQERPDVAFMMAALFARDDSLRAKATEIVACYCQDKAFFNVSLEDDSVEVRRAVVSALCDNLIPDAQEILSSCLADPDPHVMIYAAQGLYVLKDPRGVEVLIQKLQDDNPDIRLQAVQAAGRYTIAPLMKHLGQIVEEDSERSVRSAALEAIEQLQRAEEEAALRNIRVHIEHISVTEHPLLHCYVSVLGESGQAIHNLKREHFAMEETGIAKQDFLFDANPDTVPMNVAIVMDYSDFMDDDDIEMMEQGVEQILSQLPEGVKASIVKFAAEAELIQELTMERDLLQKAIRQPYGGDTDGVALYDAIFRGIEPMVTNDSIHTVVAFASGSDDSSMQSRMKLIRYAANHQVCIHLIECNPPPDPEDAQALTKSTNGQHWPISPTLSMSRICRRLADILSHHYVLSYHTTPKGPMRGIATVSVTVSYKHFDSRMTVQLPKV